VPLISTAESNAIVCGLLDHRSPLAAARSADNRSAADRSAAAPAGAGVPPGDGDAAVSVLRRIVKSTLQAHDPGQADRLRLLAAVPSAPGWWQLYTIDGEGTFSATGVTTAESFANAPDQPAGCLLVVASLREVLRDGDAGEYGRLLVDAGALAWGLRASATRCDMAATVDPFQSWRVTQSVRQRNAELRHILSVVIHETDHDDA